MSNTIDIEKYLKERLGVKDLKRTLSNQYRFNCVICGDTRKRMFISRTNLMMYCQNCGWKGHFINFIKLIEKVSTGKEAFNILNNIGSIVSPKTFQSTTQEEVKPNRESIEPPEFLRSILDGSIDSSYPIQYLVSRGFGIETMKYYQIGYCVKGKYRHRIIIPIFEDNRLVYYVARSYVDNYRKVINPPNSLKSLWIFNLNNAINYDCIIISEGWADAMSIGANAVALLGKTISDDQLSKLRLYNTKKFVVFLDDDALLSAIELANKLTLCGLDVDLVMTPEGMGDPNDLMLSNNLEYVFQNCRVPYNYRINPISTDRKSVV